MKEVLKAISITGKVLGLLLGEDFFTPSSQVTAWYPYFQLNI